jgi:hypothetical protein
MMRLIPLARLKRPLKRELVIILAFVSLTLIMTWPWILHIRDAVPDKGDPYILAWTLWWDYHQTLHHPLQLFNANIFFPYQDTLAFGENAYGIALLFFPLFALGLRPLTIYSIATLAGFALSGYGAFRLARTLSGSNGVAWVAGLAFAFVPYRFFKLPHLHYMFAVWIPLVLESLVLFARERSWKRAGWLGCAFLMNALTCITWFILTLIPLSLSGIVLLVQYRCARDKAFWLRGGLALALASLFLLAFLWPYYRVSRTHGFVRNAQETTMYSARPGNFLVVGDRNKLWAGKLSGTPSNSETMLFPGFMPVLFALLALLLCVPARRLARAYFSTLPTSQLKRAPLILLDLLAILSLITALLAFAYGVFAPTLFGVRLFKARTPTNALIVCAVIIISRCLATYLTRSRARAEKERRVIELFQMKASSWMLINGAVWTIIGFMGALGMNFYFHRALFEFVPLFRIMRVPARWAMICYLGMSLLAGLGAQRIAATLSRWRPDARGKLSALVYTILALAILFEQRVAPMKVLKGEADPDQLTLRLKATEMRGGIVELPTGGPTGNYLYVLRAADHARPLITATNSFVPPLEARIESLTHMKTIPSSLLDLLESIPASYVVVHYDTLPEDERQSIEALLANGIETGRLRFIKSYTDAGRADLYALTKTEPQAQSEEPSRSLLPAL